jgi:hypothetical protein
MAAPLDLDDLQRVLAETFEKVINSPGSLKKAILNLNLKYHPDKHPEDTKTATIFMNSIASNIRDLIGTNDNITKFSNSQKTIFIDIIRNPERRAKLISDIIDTINIDLGGEAGAEAQARADEEAQARAAAAEAQARAAEEAQARAAAAKAQAKQSNWEWTRKKDYWDSIINSAFKKRKIWWWTQGGPGPTKAQVVALAEKTLKALEFIAPDDLMRRATALREWSEMVYGKIPDETGYPKTLNARHRKLDKEFDALLVTFEELAASVVRQAREQESREEEARRAREEEERRAREEEAARAREEEARAREETARRATKLAEAKAAAELPLRQIKEKLERLKHEYSKAHNRSSARWMADNTNQGILEEYLDTEADLAEAIARTPLKIQPWGGLPDFSNMNTLEDQLNYITNQIERAGVDVRFIKFDTINDLKYVIAKIRDVISNNYSIRTDAGIIPAISDPNYKVLNTSRAYLDEQLKRLEAANEARAKASGTRPGMFSRLGRFAGLFGGRKSRKARKTKRRGTRRA